MFYLELEFHLTVVSLLLYVIGTEMKHEAISLPLHVIRPLLGWLSTELGSYVGQTIVSRTKLIWSIVLLGWIDLLLYIQCKPV